MMTEAHYIKLPRLYVDAELNNADNIALGEKNAHYLGNVLRLQKKAKLRLFNGHEGEWLGEIAMIAKKTASVKLLERLRPQIEPERRIHLLFPPIKKDRLDFLIEKAVELGAAALHPVLTEHTQIRKTSAARLRAQIIEAAEQCERLDIPTLHPLTNLQDKLAHWNPKIPLLACIERSDAISIGNVVEKHRNDDIACLVGPEGGFAGKEKKGLKQYGFVHAVSLGETILRTETAALKCLSLI